MLTFYARAFGGMALAAASCGGHASTRLDASAGDGASVDGPAGPVPTLYAGGNTACAITAAGVLQCWSAAQLTPTTVAPGTSFLEAAMNNPTGCAIASDHSLICFDLATLTSAPKDNAHYSQVEVGNGGCAVRDDGALVCFGGPTSFLGLDPATAQLGTDLDWSLVSVGNVHACAIKTSGALSCWGANFNGASGTGNPAAQEPTPTPVSGGGTWIDVSAGDVSEASCGLHSDHTLWCWGYLFGTAGTSRVPLLFDTATDWAKVRVVYSHACAIKTSGELYCWGGNQQGQLGTGDMLPQARPTRVGTDTDWRDVAVGALLTCALKRTGHVRCWGAITTDSLDF